MALDLPIPGVTPGPEWAAKLNAALDELAAAYNAAIPSTQKAVANGVATLDSSTLVPLTQLPLPGIAASPALQDAMNSVVRPGRGYLPRYLYRMFPGYLSKWHAGIRAVLQGDRDAKLLIIGTQPQAASEAARPVLSSRRDRGRL